MLGEFVDENFSVVLAGGRALSKALQDEDAAREHLENLLWKNGPVCQHCGVLEEHIKPTQGPMNLMLSGVVEVDETYIGGKEKGVAPGPSVF